MAEIMMRFCESCSSDREHEVVRRRNGALTLKCASCSKVVRVSERTSRTKEVRVIVSRGERSTPKKIALPEDEMIAVGDELIVDSKRVRVSAIESDGSRVDSAAVEDIATLWATYYESIAVHFSINKGSATISEIVHAPPEEEFSTDTIEEIKGRKVLIHAIRTNDGMVHDGSATAEEIVRIYAKYVRERWMR